MALSIGAKMVKQILAVLSGESRGGKGRGMATVASGRPFAYCTIQPGKDDLVNGQQQPLVDSARKPTRAKQGA